jgi:fibronectin-binding autotransporter adhesin
MKYFAVLLSCALFFTVSAFSANVDTWDGGGGNDDWGTGQNWADDSAPSLGSEVHFAGTLRLTPNWNYGDYDNMYRIFFDSGASSFTLGSSLGRSMKLTYDGGNAPKIENNSSNTQTISSGIPNLVFDFSGEINPVAGNLVIGSTIYLDNSGSLSVWGDNGNTVTFNGAINNGSGGGGHGFMLKQNSIVIFNANNGYTGQTEIDRGELRIGEGAGMGGGQIFLGNGGSLTGTAKLIIADSNGGTTVDENIQVNPSSGSQYRVLGGSNTSGNNTFSGTVALQSYVEVTAASGGEVTFSNVISDGGSGYGITKTGAGTVTLSAANTYTGQTSIDAGTLKLAAANRINDSSSFYVGSGATFDLNNFDEEVGNFVDTSAGNVSLGSAQFRVNQTSDATYSGAMSGTGTFVKKGTSSLTLSGANSYSGQTYIDEGTLKYTANQAGGYTGAINVGKGSPAGAATLAMGSGVTLGNNITILSGSGSTKTIQADGNSTVGGNITMNDVLRLNASGGNLTVNGAISNSGNNLTNIASGGNITLAGAISGGGKLVKQGTGNLTLSNSGNSYTGNTEIDQGTLIVSGNIASGSSIFIGNGTAPFANANARLDLAANGVNLGGPVQVNVADTGGTGTRTIASTAASGGTTISGGLTVNRSTTFQATSGSALTLSGNMALNNSSAATFNNTSLVTVSGDISGNGSLVKQGTGKLILSGSNNYSGGTTVSTGTLAVNGTAGNVTVGSGAVLQGSGTVGIISGAGLVSPGNSPGILTASQVDPSLGTDYGFEFTQTGNPTWSNASASGNDVQRLTHATTPFLSSLDSDNVVGIYFNVTSLTLGQTYRGGFFTDKDEDFGSSVVSALYNYYVKGDGGGAIVFNGVNYYTLAQYNSSLFVNNSIFQVATANFSGGDVNNGWVQQFQINEMQISAVPEPSMIMLFLTGLVTLYARRRFRKH